MIRNIEYDLRKFNSLILRVILIIVLISISYYNDNIFSELTYTISLVLYIISLILNFVFSNRYYKGLVRLLLDLGIIGVYLYGKELNFILNYLPFLILLFNIQNHSNRKSRVLIFVCLLHLDILIINNFNVKLTNHLIPLIFYVFNFMSYIRKSIINVNEEISFLVSDLFIENVNENNSHRILKDVIAKINKSKVRFINEVEEIFLFIHNNGNFVLIKGSKFLIKNNLSSSVGIHNITGSTRKTVKDRVSIDDREYKVCYWLNHRVQEKNYYFLVSLKKESFFNESLIKNLRPIFEYIARIYYMSNSLTIISNENLKIIKQKIAYVFDAQNALHFVKNKLSPITSTIDLMDRYFKQQNLSEEHKKYIERRLFENNNNKEIKQIITKAEVLIKGVDNILEEKDKIISLKTLIDDIRKCWLFHFNTIDDVYLEIEDFNNIQIEINQMMFDFIFTDIVENINKYGVRERRKVVVKNYEGNVVILFSNEIIDYEKNRQDLEEIIALYNLTNNDEIYSRRTHGLSFIRRLLRRKNIENRVYIDKELKTFNSEIKIKIYRNENIGI